MRVVTPQQGYGAHVPRAVVLEHSASPDPLTVEQSQTIDQWGGVQPAASDDANAAAELDAIVTSIHLKKNEPAGAAPVQVRQGGSGLTLPQELARHFDGLPGETLVWSARFDVPLYASGTIAVTTQRVLSVYRRQFWRILPPGREIQVRRHQIYRDADLKTEWATSRRPSLLVAGLVCVAWFPFGTIVGGIAVGLYWFAGRRELAIIHKRVKRLYPLASADIFAAMAACKPVANDNTDADATDAPARAS
jgi:hypothetical protein